jgi:hypothetical protein
MQRTVGERTAHLSGDPLAGATRTMRTRTYPPLGAPAWSGSRIPAIVHIGVICVRARVVGTADRRSVVPESASLWISNPGFGAAAKQQIRNRNGRAVGRRGCPRLLSGSETRQGLIGFTHQVELRGRLSHTVVVEAAPESHLRLLAEQALAQAEPGDEFLVASAGLHAVANAYVMLGLLTESKADAVLEPASEALTARGLPGSWLSIRSGAHDYWQLRSRGRDGLSWIPRAVAISSAHLAAGSADVRFEWLRLSHAGLRFQVQATAAGEGLPQRHAGLALADLSLADDAGHPYQMYWDGGSGNNTLWVGDVVALPEPPDDVAWFELRAIGSAAALRVLVPAPLPIQVGTADPPWPTAAESYLALLSAQDPPQAIGRSRGGHVVAAVAEALFLVGAIPAHSPLLPRALGREKRSSHPVLPKTWPSPVRRATQPDMRIAICAALPFSDAAVAIEGLSAWGEDIQLHVYGWPWVHSERWPMAIPSFTVRAIDDLGDEHEGATGQLARIRRRNMPRMIRY